MSHATDASPLRTESVNGVRYRWRDAGQGPALLLLHGFTGSLHTWDPFLPELARHFRVIAVDLPGHGGTDAPGDPERYRMERCIADLLAILDGLGVDRTAVLGYSMGGRVALHLAAAAPQRVEGLIVESGSPGIADAAERAARIASDRALADFIEREGVAAFVERWERLPLFASQAGLPEPVRASLRAQRLRNRAAGLANSLWGMGAGVQPPLHDRLADLTMPTLLIAGELDEKYVRIVTDMAAHMPNARTAVVPGAGHAVHLERPTEFLRVVTAFLREQVVPDRG